MTNTYRIKENIVHISMNAGSLIQQEGIEVDSSTLTDFIIELADRFEEKVVPTLKDGEYLEAIDFYSNKELLKRFSITNFIEIGSMMHCHDNTATYHFFVNEDEVFQSVNGNKKIKPLYKQTMKLYLLQKGYKTTFQQINYEDSVLTVNVKIEKETRS